MRKPSEKSYLFINHLLISIRWVFICGIVTQRVLFPNYHPRKMSKSKLEGRAENLIHVTHHVSRTAARFLFQKRYFRE